MTKTQKPKAHHRDWKALEHPITIRLNAPELIGLDDHMRRHSFRSRSEAVRQILRPVVACGIQVAGA